MYLPHLFLVRTLVPPVRSHKIDPFPFSPSCASKSTRFFVLCFANQFDYDNGVGSSVDRFAIDLYKADGRDDCGTWVASICDKPTIGCKDSSEYYVWAENRNKRSAQTRKRLSCFRVQVVDTGGAVRKLRNLLVENCSLLLCENPFMCGLSSSRFSDQMREFGVEFFYRCIIFGLFFSR